MLVPGHRHGHRGPGHVHLVATHEAHVVEVVVVVERVARVGGGPRDAAVGYEQAADHAHATVRKRLTGGGVVPPGHAVAGRGPDVAAEAGTSVEKRDGNR